MATTQRITGSYVEWAPIIGGAFLACAISAVLLQFGGALGFTASRIAYYSSDNLQWRVIIIGLWLLWVQIIASMTGGYIAGRLRELVDGANAHESEVRDGMHGLLVWATATLMMVIAVAAGSFLTALAAAHGVDVQQEEMLISEELARKSAIILGFLMATSSLASAIAAWYAATVGGDHRDTAVDLSRFFSFKKR